FQSYALYPHMTVRDNIAYPLRVRKISRRERDRQATTVAESLMIGPLLDRKPRELSGGQRQHVALARAIVRQPAVFLMDEPLSNLDAKLRIQMRVELKRLQRELNVTTLYVTHDQSEATTMADLVAVMATGRLEQLGTPREIYNFPGSETVARFVGSPPMNVSDVGISDSRLFLGSQEFPIDDDIGHRIRDAAKGREIRLGVRPEDLVLATDEWPALDSEVYVVQPMDNETLITFRCADSTLLTGRFAADFEPAVGSRLRIKARDDRLHIFDRSTGESLLATRWPGDTAGPRRPDAGQHGLPSAAEPTL
ncbi:MAG: ABC transporter ATP-binding protein, partial [Streptosporangiaceae bacterium]